MAPLNALKKLVRLHEEGVGGVEDQLRQLVTDDPEGVAKVLFIDPARLDGSIGQVRRCLKAGYEKTRADKLAEARRQSATLATDIVNGAKRRRDGSVELPMKALSELARLASHPYLHFAGHGRMGMIEILLVRQVFKECGTTKIRSVRLTGTHVAIEYDTPHSRGSISLAIQRLHGIDPDDVLVIDLGRVEAKRVPRVVSEEPRELPPTAPWSPDVLPPPGPLPSAPQPARGFWGHFIQALQQALP